MKKYILAVAFCLLSFSTFAATITVTFGTDEYTDNDDCSLREAITNANNDNSTSFDECVATGDYGDDTITLQDTTTYYLSLQGSGNDTNTLGDLDITDGLTLTSSGSAFIDAQDLDGLGDPDRILHFQSTETLNLSNITFQYGSLDVVGVSLFGSALYISSTGTVNIDNCEFTLNTMNVTGTHLIKGGVIGSSTLTSLTISNSTFHHNTMDTDPAATGDISGGIIYVENFADVTIEDSSFYDNTITSYGQLSGGILRLIGDDTTSTATISGTNISSNTVTSNNASFDFGGIIRATQTNLSLLNSGIASNAFGNTAGASVFGATIMYSSSSATQNDFTITNSTVAYNTAYSTGGTLNGNINLQGTESEVRISHSTFANNAMGDASTTETSGGVIFDQQTTGSITLKANILINNTVTETAGAGAGANCFKAAGLTPTSAGYNVSDDLGCSIVLDGTDTTTDPDLQAFGDNGGNSNTFAILDTSSAYNLNTTCTDVSGDDVTTDQRGAPRDDGNCDAGAYELGTFYLDLDTDTFGDVTDAGTTTYDTALVTDHTDCDDAEATTNTAADELCGDGIDNDCDSTIDEGFEDLDAACSVGTGACADTGTYECSADNLSLECNGVEGTPTDELCGDEIDNNCDGDTDEGFEDRDTACSVGVGACADPGSYQCTEDGLSLECNAVEGEPVAEICDDDADNDCDGATDSDDADCAASGDDDTDSDGIADSADNCPDDSNADQLDTDEDGTGDECEVATSSGGGGCQLTTAPHFSAIPMALSVLGLSGLAAARLRRRSR